MFESFNRNVAARLITLIGVFALGFVVYGAWSFKTLNDLKVNGPLYHRIVLGKDLVADVLPPPQYIIESYLLSLQMQDADRYELDRLVKRFETLKLEYDLHHEAWLKEDLEPELSDVFLQQTYEPATTFYRITLEEYIPALRKADSASAKKSLVRMKAAYEQHRKAIDQVVQIAKLRNSAMEEVAKSQIRSDSIVLLAILCTSLFVGSIVGYLITRSVTGPLGGEPHEAVTIFDRIAAGDLSINVPVKPNDNSSLMFAVRQMRDSLRRLMAEQRLAASVFTHAREGILITDPDANIVEVNHAFTVITGYSREEVLGKNPRILSSGKQDKDFYAVLWQDLLNKGDWHGEVWNRRKDGSVYAELLTISAICNEHGETENYIALFSDITPLKNQQAQLERIAHYDALTGLPNRLLLADRLRQAMHQATRRGQRLAGVYLDLDGFKAVNDTYGHEVGDRLLIAVAKRMGEALREGDTLARIGGDEFVAVLVDLADAESAIPALQRLLQAAAEPVVVASRTLKVSASIGVSMYPQHEEIDADQLMRQADQAMYQAKQSGRNRYHIFNAAQPVNVL